MASGFVSYGTQAGAVTRCFSSIELEPYDFHAFSAPFSEESGDRESLLSRYQQTNLHLAGAFCQNPASFWCIQWTIMKTYFGKMRGEPARRPRADWQDALWSWAGAFAGMGAICWLSAHWLSDQLLILGSFGATSVLIYAAPQSPFAQPRNVLLGSMLSAGVGVACVQALGTTALAVALAVSLAILVMQLTHTVHPPGAAAGLIAVVGGPEVEALGWWYPLLPVGLGCAVMLVVAILVNNLARHRRYPVHWR